MGVPALFRWLSSKYPKIISQVIEEQPQQVDGQEIPIDIRGSNPNGEECDNLYLDMNGIVHPCSHPTDSPPPANEAEMMSAIYDYTDRVMNMVRPRKILMIAIDGVAPRAKMNQQRARRFRSAQEAKEKDEDKEELMKMLKSQNGGVLKEGTEDLASKRTWDSNVITPGTPFMTLLAASLRYWCAKKINEDPGWRQVKVIISDATVPGEGEHKIMEFIRSQRASPTHDPNTRHVMYGLDADLIMLGLGTHEPHFRILREDVFFQESKARTCNLCGQKGHIAEACRGEAKPKEGDFGEKDKALADKPFIWLHVSILREYLAAELHPPGLPFKFDLERALDDWVFMCFFVGNDFLPHLPSLNIRENGIDTLIAIWRDNLPLMQGYLTKDGHVDLERCQFVLDGLAKQEDAIFRRRKETEDRKAANAKRRKLEQENRNNHRQSSRVNGSSNGGQRGPPDYASRGRGRASDPVIAPPELPLFTPGKRDPTREERAITHDMIVNRSAVYKANAANKSAAAALKSQLLNGKTERTESQAQSQDTDQTNSASETHGQTGEVADSDRDSKKRKAGVLEGDGENEPATESQNGASKPNASSDEPPEDTVRLWEQGYADRYYEQKFKVDPKDIAFRNQVANDYLMGLKWVLLYYFQGCPSWTWYYPHHYAPFAADFVNVKDQVVKFEKGKPFKPFEQLMGVLPAASNHAIPEVFRSLMSDEESPIIDFYPENFELDLNGEAMKWKAVILLPFIDEKRLLDAMATRYPLLSAEENARNETGKDALIIHDKHALFDNIADHFYSKRQGTTKYELDSAISEGLAGTVEKNEGYIPQTSLISNLPGLMPDIEDNHSMSVYYEMPPPVHLHKSMLLRGVKFPPPTLDHTDIEATKHQASRSGRSFGGAPLRGGSGNGHGRGGYVNYAADRPNPFAAYVPAGFGPPPNFQQHGYAPPPGHQNYNGNQPSAPQWDRGYSNRSQQPQSNGHYGQYQQSYQSNGPSGPAPNYYDRPPRYGDQQGHYQHGGNSQGGYNGYGYGNRY